MGIKGNIDKFWKAHSKSPIFQIPEAKDLLTRMLCFDATKRIDMNGIKNHKWFNGETLKQKELINEIRDRHRKAEKKRQDVRKMNDLAQSLNPNKPIPGIEEAITGKGQGKCRFDFDKGILNCEKNVARNTATKSEQEQKEQVPVMDAVKFDVEIFESRVWKSRYLELEEKEEILEKNIHRIFIVRISRIEGDPLVFTKLKNGFMLTYCSSIIKGLPDWARKLEKEDAKKLELEKKENDEQSQAELVDEYSKELGDYFAAQNKGGIQIAVKQ